MQSGLGATGFLADSPPPPVTPSI